MGKVSPLRSIWEMRPPVSSTLRLPVMPLTACAAIRPAPQVHGRSQRVGASRALSTCLLE